MTEDAATMTGTGEGTASETPTPQAGRSATRSLPLGSRPSSDLVDFAEIAKRTGTTPGNVRSWRNRNPDFPPPFARYGNVPVWEWADIVAWLATPGRKR